MTEKILIISGATATGKSQLALEFAQKKEIGIINADSLQIYQSLPILSAQPTEEQKAQVPHFLYSHLEPKKRSSVGLWLKLIEPVISYLWNRKKLPVIVGGTGLYISKLIDGISEIPEIEIYYEQRALQLFEELGKSEFEKRFGEGKIIDKNRLLRACEVFLQTGKPISFWQKNSPKKIFPNAHFIHLNLNPDREIIYQNCNLRFQKMLDLGALEEVKSFLEKYETDLEKLGGNRSCQIYNTLGFWELALCLKNEISLEFAVQIASQKTRNYAKRQITWFKHQFSQITFCNDRKDFFEKTAKI